MSGDYQPDFLAVVFQASQPGAAGSSGFADVGEAPFHSLGSQLLQTLVAVAFQTTSIGSVGGFVIGRLVRPATVRAIRLADVCSQFIRPALRQRFVFCSFGCILVDF